LQSDPEGRIWSGDRLGILRRHSATGETEVEHKILSDARLLSMVFSPDGQRLAVGNLRGEVAEVDPANGEIVRQFAPLASRCTCLIYLNDQLIAGDYLGNLYRMQAV